jgi:outer membrane receptor for ferric coprogen and ferric-rhodotorulic acid
MEILLSTRRASLCALMTGAVWIIGGLSSTAIAEEAASQDDPSILEKVTVMDSAISPYTVDQSGSATKLSLSLRDTPQSITIITRERLDDQNLLTLRDVLDDAPGIYSYQYDTERVLFSARGFVIDSLQYDSVPAVYSFNTSSIDEWLDTALYERIEIVRGATGLMSGAGNPAAAINLVRKHASSKEREMQLKATAGSWNNYRAEADFSTPLNAEGSIRGRVVGVYQDRESYQDLYQAQSMVAYGVVDVDLAENTHASVGFDYQEKKPDSNTWGSFPMYLGDGTAADWSRSVTTSTDWAFWDRRKKTAFAELTHAFKNGWSLRGSANWRQFDDSSKLFYVFGFPDPQTGEGLDPSAYRSTSDITETAVDIYGRGPFELFGRQHELVIGYNGSQVDASGDEYAAGELVPVPNFFQWNGSYPEPQFATEPTPVMDHDIKQNGFYTAARFELADPLKLIAGARFNTFDMDYFYLYDAVGFEYDFDKTIPYAGIIYDLNRSFSTFVSYTEIFKPQNSRDINGTYLDPIDGRSFEVGIKGEHFEGRLYTALTLFQTQQNNVAGPVFDPDTGEAILLPDGTSVSRAIDGTETRGFEFEMTGELRPGWNASLSWTRYNLEDAEGNDVRTFTPRTLIRTFTTWNAPGAWSRLTLGGGVNYQSSSYTQVGTPLGGTLLNQGGVTLLSLMARYQLTPGASVQINGDNLLDKKYFVLDEYDNTYFGAPLNVSVGVSVRF